MKIAHQVAKAKRGRGRGEQSVWTLGAKAKTVRGPYKTRAKTKMPINGERLSLFLLEHLDDATERPPQFFFDALAEAGSPIRKKQAFNGPMSANLVRFGYAKRTDKGFSRTSKGTQRMIALRTMLEAQGKVRPGAYL